MVSAVTWLNAEAPNQWAAARIQSVLDAAHL
jgi:hypothetical protein